MGNVNIIEAVKTAKQQGRQAMKLICDERKNFAERIRRVREETKERIANIESNKLAQMLLGSEGLLLDINTWNPQYAQLDLESAKLLPKVRRALGVPLKLTGEKSLVERSHSKIWVGLKADGFSGLRIRYKAKLTTGAKCKIVKTRQVWSGRRLVCEA